jgi:predicted RNA methylase
MGSAESGYQLGSDAAELERLDLQGRVLAPATRTILQMAGVRRDMRVLDLGSGAGDVAFVAAELAGPAGEVVGIDQSPDSVAKATARAAERGLPNVRFVVGRRRTHRTPFGTKEKSPAGRRVKGGSGPRGRRR